LVIKKDSCLNLPADLEFDHFEIVSCFNPELKTYTLIFNGSLEEDESKSSKEDDHTSKNYLAQVIIG